VYTLKEKCSDNDCWVSPPVGNHNVVDPFIIIMGLANNQQDVETYVEDNSALQDVVVSTDYEYSLWKTGWQDVSLASIQ